MKARTFVASLTGLLLIAVCAGAVEPSYEGRLGNPEEPALRPYKWLWHGLESLVYYAGESIQHGNMKTPVLGMSEIGRGLRKGNIELGESLQNGILFAPLPANLKQRQFGRINEALEEREKCKETADFLFGGPLYPIMKLTVDKYPAIKDKKPTQPSTPGGIELTGFPQPPHGVLDSPLSDYPAHKMCGCPYCALEKHNAEPVAKE